MKPLYVMLIGLPGSGKSTLAKVIQAAHPGANWHVVSTDDYIEAEAAKRGTTYDAVFKETIDEATTRMNVLRGEAMAARRNIIHDQTNLTIKSRARKLAGIPANYWTIGVLCSVPEDERAERLKNRPGKVIPPHIDRHMVADLMSGTDGEFGAFWDSAEDFERFSLRTMFGD